MKRPTCIPNNAFVYIPDEWKLTDSIRVGPFAWECHYTNGHTCKTESELLTSGIACYRVQLDRFTVQDFVLNY